MKVGLVGFGKTGRAVASVLLESDEVKLQWAVRKTKNLEHRSIPEFLGVTPSVDPDEPGLIYSKNEYTAGELLTKLPVDVIIDFSSEDGIDYYGEEAKRRGVSIISAISFYSEEKIEYLKQLAEGTRVVYSPNITIGINFLMIAGRVLKNIAPYTDIVVLEEHYKGKPEISGTARRIAQGLEVPEDEIKTIRAGGIVSVHEILFGFPQQTVRLKHEAITREAFGNGALFAAKHINEKNIGFYSMEDLLLPYFQINTPEEQLEPTKKPWWKIW